MKTKLLLILSLIALMLISCSKQESDESQIIFFVKQANEIDKIILHSLDHPYSYPDIELTNPDKIRELWNYVSSIKVREIESKETYIEPTKEWELNIFHDNGNEILQILHQGTLIRKEERIYIPIESKIDIDYILKNFH